MPVYLLISLLFTHSLFAESCFKKEAGARQIFAKEWGAESSHNIGIYEHSAGPVNIYRVIAEDSCGVRGCEFAIYSENQIPAFRTPSLVPAGLRLNLYFRLTENPAEKPIS